MWPFVPPGIECAVCAGWGGFAESRKVRKKNELCYGLTKPMGFETESLWDSSALGKSVSEKVLSEEI